MIFNITTNVKATEKNMIFLNKNTPFYFYSNGFVPDNEVSITFSYLEPSQGYVIDVIFENQDVFLIFLNQLIEKKLFIFQDTNIELLAGFNFHSDLFDFLYFEEDDTDERFTIISFDKLTGLCYPLTIKDFTRKVNLIRNTSNF